MKHPPRIPRGDNSSKNTSSLTPPDPQHLQSPENSGASVALRTLQFLPLPLLVLSAQKTVVLANDAMRELLGTNRKLLRGKSLDALGIELLADNGSWDLLLEDARIGNNGRQIVEVPQSDGHVRLCEAMVSPWKGVGGEMHFTVMFWREPLETIKDVGDSKSLPSASSLINSAQPVNGKVSGWLPLKPFNCTCWIDLTHPLKQDSRVLSSSSFVQSRSLNRWTPQFLQQLPAPSLRIIRPLDSIIEQMVSGRLIFEAGNYLPDKDKGGGEDVGALTPRVLDLQQRLDAEEAKFRKMYDCIPRMVCEAVHR
jgi:hypothetical protein